MHAISYTPSTRTRYAYARCAYTRAHLRAYTQIINVNVALMR